MVKPAVVNVAALASVRTVKQFGQRIEEGGRGHAIGRQVHGIPWGRGQGLARHLLQLYAVAQGKRRRRREMGGRRFRGVTLDACVHRRIRHLAGCGVERPASLFGALFRGRGHQSEINGFGHAGFGQPNPLLDEPETVQSGRAVGKRECSEFKDPSHTILPAQFSPRCGARAHPGAPHQRHRKQNHLRIHAVPAVGPETAANRLVPRQTGRASLPSGSRQQCHAGKPHTPRHRTGRKLTCWCWTIGCHIRSPGRSPGVE
jgi:hypothetical protein